MYSRIIFKRFKNKTILLLLGLIPEDFQEVLEDILNKKITKCILKFNWNNENTIKLNEMTIKFKDYTISRFIKVSKDKIISISTNNNFKLWDLSTGKSTYSYQQLKTPINDGVYLENYSQTQIIAGLNYFPLVRSVLYAFNKEDLTIAKIIAVNEDFQITAAALINKFQIALGNTKGYIKILDIATGKLVMTLSDISKIIHCLIKLSPSQLVSSENDIIKIWDLSKEECIMNITGHTRMIKCLVKIHKTQIASGSMDKSIKIWNAVSGKCKSTLTGHNLSITCLLKLKETRIVSGSEDKTIKLWDLQAFFCLATIKMHTGIIQCLLKINKTQILSGSLDNTIRLWDLSKYSSHIGVTMDKIKDIIKHGDIKTALKDKLYVKNSKSLKNQVNFDAKLDKELKRFCKDSD